MVLFSSIRDVCELVTDGTHYTPKNVGAGFPFLTVKDIKDDHLDLKTCSFISEEDYIEACNGNSSPHPLDVLFSKDGTVGKVHVVKTEEPFAVLSSIAILRPKIDVIDSNYLGYTLKSPLVLDQAIRRKTGSAIRRIILADLSAVKIPLPPIDQQKRIAAILDKAEELRSLRRQSIEQLDVLAQSIFTSLFGDPLVNPLNFPCKKMIDIVDPERPITYGILMPGPEQLEGVKYVRVVDMKDGGIKLAGIRKTTPEISYNYRRSLLKSGDLLMSIRGHVGRLAIIPKELDGANITQDSARLAIKNASAIYIQELLRTTSLQRWMDKHTKGVAVRGINLGDIKLIPTLLPPLSLQQEFAQRVEAINKLKTVHRESLAQLDKLFASLQHRAFRGEL
jgi:type I restriction enzyme, S subunit